MTSMTTRSSPIPFAYQAGRACRPPGEAAGGKCRKAHAGAEKQRERWGDGGLAVLVEEERRMDILTG